MPTIAEVRQKFPQYNDMSDDALANALHQKFYSDMPRAEFDQKIGLGRPQARGVVEQAIEPITSYPSTYAEMNRQSRDLMSEGVNQVGEGGVGNIASGAVKTALGGLGYVASPINAALRTVVGKPVENITGIPKEYSEFAASLALPLPKRVPLPNAAPAARAAVPTAEELGNAASAAYREARGMGVEFRPMSIAHEATGIESRLVDAGFAPDNAPLTFNAIRSLQNPPAGSRFTASNFETARQRLVKAGQAPGPDSAASRQAINALDDYLSNIPRNDVVRGDAEAVSNVFQRARADYAASRRMGMVEGRQELADLNASTAHSGMNGDNAIRQATKSLIRPNMQGVSAAERAGFTPEEIAQARVVAEGTPVQNLTRGVSSLLGGGGGLGALHAGVTGAAAGYATHGLPGLALGLGVPAVGHVLRRISTGMAERESQRLAELVASRSPYAQRVQQPLSQWANATQEFEISPTARNFARLSLASKNLSTNLADFGISTSPDQLVKAGAAPSQPEQPSTQ